MKNLIFMLFTMMLIIPSISSAQYSDEDIDLFGTDDSDSLNPTTEDTSDKILSSFISSRISLDAANNIEKAEKVFCYTVDLAPIDYDGYVIHSLAVLGSCGELSEKGRNLIKDVALHSSSLYSTSDARCDISPKILLRYIYGIDSTDILLSSPCHSLTFFHGRDITTINAAPGKEIIDQIVNTYSSISEKFLSPALLGQMVPNGQVITQDQKEIVRKTYATENLKKWNKPSNQKQATSQPEKKAPTKKGWNKLK